MAKQIHHKRTQEETIRDDSQKYMTLRRKTTLRKVLFKQIPDTINRTELLRHKLPEEWKISAPEAIISITGIDHQFNLKDKHNLKRHLIDAVLSTGSWIVTCGTESEVVEFIKDAVNEQIALKDFYIPIVGLLSQNVLDEIKHKKTISGSKKSTMKNTEKDKYSHLKKKKKTLDPNHTQFIFIDGKHTSARTRTRTRNSTLECREAFNNFLSCICDENADGKTEAKITCDKLPIVLVLIEGGVDAMRTASTVMKGKNPIIAIEGSGGAANFLASCYWQKHRGSNDETNKLKETDEIIEELKKECFNDNQTELEDEANKLSKLYLENTNLVYVYSLEDKTAKVDEYIQNAIFKIYKDCYENMIKEVEDENNMSNGNMINGVKDKNNESIESQILKNSIKKQLKLVEKWKRYDIADKEIFIARNRHELSQLQKQIEQLFLSSLKANRTDIVKLIIDRIENMGSFVLQKIFKVYKECIQDQEELAINLIVQEWSDTHKNTDVNEEYKILFEIELFVRDVIGDTNCRMFDLTETKAKPDTDGKKKGTPENTLYIYYIEKPFYHLFVWAVLMNWKDMAMIFLEKDTDYTCSALFASAVLNKLADVAYVSNNMELRTSLLENAKYFEILACSVMTELYKTDRTKALKTLVTTVDRYSCTPIAMAWSQKLRTFMAITACQAKLNSIWRGDIALHTQSWRIGMTVFLPLLLIPNLGFISFKNNPRQILPSADNSETTDGQSAEEKKAEKRISNKFFQFYTAPIVKFFFYMITYLTFLVIFSLFVLTDLYPLSERSPSIFEYVTWIWAASLAVEELRQMLQTDKGSFSKNIKFWAKDVWNIFDLLMYLLFFVSVILRVVLSSEDFYFARMTYVVTLAMFILRSMHFFFVTKEIGPKVVMIGKMLEDLAFFISLFALFVFSFGIMYQAILFPNSVLSSWELFKELIYLPYWQLYGELFLDRIEGTEPSECTHNPLLYTNGTMLRCAQTNQFNSPMLAVYLVLANILLVNILIAMFSYTFQKVQDNSEIIWRFHRYSLVYEYYDMPMFPIPIVIHLCRIIVFCYYKIRKLQYKSDFALRLEPDDVEKLNRVESIALERYLNAPTYARSRYETRNMVLDEREIPGEKDAINTYHDIDDLHEEMNKMHQSLKKEIRQLALRQPVVVVDFPGNYTTEKHTLLQEYN
ncbi:transient receptor potential cation channel subfamily M member-like 2 [Mytilus californianus]|uniref:transient receptor potential cation channel subfamily M member-like 2 n=1 Tax=Mytilus californianus TaxID=6549 RepID=UPI0022453CDA|nr:transient receptor potential cation channel subfamily M member-like 2 [Mytilus californianus]XP_052077431.1 transient receptor potential cation channel subfamily M member-like 2 [Mytilus californianus]XP_052077432.1 transient receptor potential cation channel subfamily M member-like 2 [Mytilus californianus]XP_052077433.1 transient receptor potential cation channel subfamily M member-like 2 [Mytilus californianus]